MKYSYKRLMIVLHILKLFFTLKYHYVSGIDAESYGWT